MTFARPHDKIKDARYQKRVISLSKKKVVVINTGGTISMEENRTGVGNAHPQRLESILSLVQSPVQVEMQHFLEKASPQITLNDMYQLAQKTQHELEKECVTGVVITHGTDTLEETAFFLHLTIPSKKPVVITGAMRSHNELGADGPRNLIQAIRVASHPSAQHRGTLVVFNDEIHSAHAVTKVHTHQPSTFQSPGRGPIGMIFHEHIQFYPSPQREPLIPLTEPKANVLLIKAVADMDDQLIQYALKNSIDGIVIEALGQGNLPPRMLPACKQAIQRKIPILLVSRCFEGGVEATYDYEGGGKQLRKQGLIFCPDLQGVKARIKLILSLSAQKNLPSYTPFYQQ